MIVNTVKRENTARAYIRRYEAMWDRMDRAADYGDDDYDFARGAGRAYRLAWGATQDGVDPIKTVEYATDNLGVATKAEMEGHEFALSIIRGIEHP